MLAVLLLMTVPPVGVTLPRLPMVADRSQAAAAVKAPVGYETTTSQWLHYKE